MTAKKTAAKKRFPETRAIVSEKSKAAWSATKDAAAQPIVRDTAKLVGQVALGTLVVMGTIKAVNTVAAL